MTDQEKSPVGANTEASGNELERTDLDNEGQQRDSVKYSTYQKVLSEKKKRDEELAELRTRVSEFESEKKSRTENELKEKQEWKKLVEIREKEIAELNEKISMSDRQFTEAKKLDAFFETLGPNVKIPKKFWVHIDPDEITIDPDTGHVDEMSVAKYADFFRREYPECIQLVGGKSSIPEKYPNGNGSALSYDEWKQLPASEMRKRLKDVRHSEGDV